MTQREESSIAILQSTQPSWNEEVVSVNQTRSLFTSVLLGSSLVKCWDKKCILHGSHYMTVYPLYCVRFLYDFLCRRCCISEQKALVLVFIGIKYSKPHVQSLPAKVTYRTYHCDNHQSWWEWTTTLFFKLRVSSISSWIWHHLFLQTFQIEMVFLVFLE